MPVGHAESETTTPTFQVLESRHVGLVIKRASLVCYLDGKSSSLVHIPRGLLTIRYDSMVRNARGIQRAWDTHEWRALAAPIPYQTYTLYHETHVATF